MNLLFIWIGAAAEQKFAVKLSLGHNRCVCGDEITLTPI